MLGCHLYFKNHMLNALLNATNKSLPNEDAVAESISTIPELKVPEFKTSDEVEFIIANIESESKNSEPSAVEHALIYLLRKVDIGDHKTNFMLPYLKDMNKHVRKTNGKLIVMQSWRGKVATDLDDTIAYVKRIKETSSKWQWLFQLLRYLLVALCSALGGILAWAQFVLKVHPGS